MRKVIGTLAVLAASTGDLARGHTISNNVGGNVTRFADQAARLNSVNDALFLAYDVDDLWTLSLAASYSSQRPAPALSNSGLYGAGGAVANLGFGIDRAIGSNWLISGMVNIVPPMEVETPTTVELVDETDATLQMIDGFVTTSTTSVDASLMAIYFSDNESWWEHTATLSLSGAHASYAQQLKGVGWVDAAGARHKVSSKAAACETGTESDLSTAACEALSLVFGNSYESLLDQLSLSASYTARLWRNTELTVGGEGFFYFQDPANLGLSFAPDTGLAGAYASAGVPVSPISWIANGAVAQKLGPVKLTLGGSYFPYSWGGDSRSASLRTTWNITPDWRLMARVAVSRDYLASGSTYDTLGATVGLRCAW